jgi:hypothetical protein
MRGTLPNDMHHMCGRREEEEAHKRSEEIRMREWHALRV